MARPPKRSVYIYVLLALVGYWIADIIILSNRHRLLPQNAPAPRPAEIQNIAQVPEEQYKIITSKNMFNMDGKIPDPLGAAPGAGEQRDEGPPVLTTIAGVQLIGTLVHSNPAKSVASVKTPSGGETVNAFKVGQTMEGVGEVLGIERGKVIFRNLVNRRKEYIELPQEGKINLGLSQGGAPSNRVEGEVAVISETERSIKREDVTRLTSNLPELLQQARAVKDGDCFKMLDIMPGSIYERLGIRRGDCIRSVNGEVVDTPQKAMEMYNSLKNSNNINLGIDRNGRPETLNFSIQ